MLIGEPRVLSTTFDGVLIEGQIFWKGTNFVDRRFSVMSPEIEFISWVQFYILVLFLPEQIF